MKRGCWAAVLLVLLTAGGGYAEEGGGAPDISLSPTGHDFGILSVPLGSGTRLFTISNRGAAPLLVSAITLSDTGNYSLDAEAGPSPCGSLTPGIAPGGECTFAVTFYPKSEGVLDTELAVVSNDPDSPRLSVTLMGFGLLCHC